MSEFKNSVEKDRPLIEIISSVPKGGELPWMSVEFFPPKTEVGLATLYKVLLDLKAYNPLFADITWGAGGSTSDLTLQIAKGIKERGVTPQMHLTCTNMEKETIDAALSTCKQAGITNILCLRGDPPVGEAKWEAKDVTLTCALDLVKYIRANYAHEDFHLCVAGESVCVCMCMCVCVCVCLYFKFLYYISLLPSFRKSVFNGQLK